MRDSSSWEEELALSLEPVAVGRRSVGIEPMAVAQGEVRGGAGIDIHS